MISVIVPVHNAGKFVRQAVTSAISQPEVSAVLLVEDGSTDDSAALCNTLARESEKVHALHHPEKDNRGAGASRNLGISLAATDFVAFLDADDYYLPDRFRKTIAILSANPQIDGVYEAVEQNGLPSHPPRLITVDPAVTPERLLSALAVGHRGSVHLNGITVRRSVFDRTGGFPEELIEAQDTVWIMKAAATSKLAGGELSRPVAVLRIHDGNRVTHRAHDRQLIVNRSLMRNKVLLDWAPQNLDTEGIALIRIFAARRMAEANTTATRNRLIRFALKRLRMVLDVRREPSLWFHPTFLSAILPRL